MQKILGLVFITLGLFMGYSVYYEYNKYSNSNAVSERAEEYAVGVQNYSAANYFHNSRNRPSWIKIAFFGIIGLGGLVIGIGIISAPEVDPQSKKTPTKK